MSEEATNPTSYPLPECGRGPGVRPQMPFGAIATEKIREALRKHLPCDTKPAHYNDTAITPFQVINDWNLDFYLGNTVKYLCRREKKGNELADLRKAAAYLAIKIEQLEAQ